MAERQPHRAPGAPDRSVEDAGFTPGGCPRPHILTAVRTLPQCSATARAVFQVELHLPITPGGGADRLVCPSIYIVGKLQTLANLCCSSWFCLSST